MHRWIRTLTLIILLAFVLGELGLRTWGIRNHPLFRADPHYEYFTLPGQHVRMGTVHFHTNEFGMRCGPVGPKRGRRVLVIGDSVVNGGNRTTQDSLGTEVAQRITSGKGEATQWLNLSAASWGAGNTAAWLNAHGFLEADEVIAVFSSHDAYDRMTFEPVVAVHPSYPDQRPTLAWSMLWRKWTHRSGARQKSDTPPVFDPGWRHLVELVREANVPFTVLLHAELDEVLGGGFDARGQRLLDSLQAWDVRVLPLLGRLPAEVYMDRIHINDRGQGILAEALIEAMQS